MAGVAPSYAAVRAGQPVAVVNSWGLLEIAVRDGRRAPPRRAASATTVEVVAA